MLVTMIKQTSVDKFKHQKPTINQIILNNSNVNLVDSDSLILEKSPIYLDFPTNIVLKIPNQMS